MEESFLNKVNTYWNKGWGENSSYEKARIYVSFVAKGVEERKRENKETKREVEDLSL